MQKMNRKKKLDTVIAGFFAFIGTIRGIAFLLSPSSEKALSTILAIATALSFLPSNIISEPTKKMLLIFLAMLAIFLVPFVILGG